MMTPQSTQQPIRLTSEDPSKNRARFYELRWEQDLFHQLVLVRTFGRIGKAGRVFSHSYPDKSNLLKDVETLIKRRLRHGYQIDQCI